MHPHNCAPQITNTLTIVMPVRDRFMHVENYKSFSLIYHTYRRQSYISRDTCCEIWYLPSTYIQICPKPAHLLKNVRLGRDGARHTVHDTSLPINFYTSTMKV